MSYELYTGNAWIKTSTDAREDFTDIIVANAKESCACPVLRKTLSMRTTTEEEPYGYPVTVYNVNLDIIGEAATKEEYITIWNSDIDNQIAGTLSGAAYPFAFTFKKNSGPVPNHVYGDPVGVEEDAVIDFDDEPIIDFDDEVILYQ